MRSLYGRPVIRGTEPKGIAELLWESITSPTMLASAWIEVREWVALG